MSVKDLLAVHHMSAHALSEATGVSYSTIYNLVHGKTTLDKCSYKTVSSIASLFNIPTDILAANDTFSHFRDELHVQVKSMGIERFLNYYITADEARAYYRAGFVLRSVYLVCMIDYLCDYEGLTRPRKYDHLRNLKFDPPVKISDWPDEELKNAVYIPVFVRNGILEGEIFDAV